MTAPTITALSAAPSRQDPDTFSLRADTLLAEFGPLVTEINAVGAYYNSNALVEYAFGAGTVAAPSIHFSGDTDTGFFRPSANKIAASVGGVEKLSLDASGLVLADGVYIGGTSTANRLDDYEEGTFTPVFHNTSGSDGGSTYSSQDGQYTKIGNAVHVRIYVSASDLGSLSGEIRIAGLPFAGTGFGAISVGYGNSMNLTTRESLGAYVALGSSSLRLTAWDDDGGTTSITASDLTDNSAVILGGTYFTTS